MEKRRRGKKNYEDEEDSDGKKVMEERIKQ